MALLRNKGNIYSLTKQVKERLESVFWQSQTESAVLMTVFMEIL